MKHPGPPTTRSTVSRGLVAACLGLAVVAPMGASGSTPPAPTIVGPSEGALVGATVTVHGTGSPVAGIEVYEEDRLVGSTQVNAKGAWTLLSAFDPGTRTIRARAIDGDQVSDFSASRTFVVDATPPTLQITTADGEVFPGGTTAVIDGIAGDDAQGVARITVEYYNLLGARAATGDAACEACGFGATEVTWSQQTGLPLPGIYTAVAWAEDVAGNRSVQRAIRIIVI